MLCIAALSLLGSACGGRVATVVEVPFQCPPATTLEVDTFGGGNNYRAAWCADTDGVLNGPWIAWYGNGATWSEATYANGRFEGVLTTWHQDGWKQVEAHYQGGVESGEWTQFHPNGTVEAKGQYVNGLREGTWVWHDPQGNEVKQCLYQEGGSPSCEMPEEQPDEDAPEKALP